MAQSLFTRCPILFEDISILVIHKPEGVLSHPNSETPKTVCAFEGPYDFRERRFETPHGPLWLIHRLDQDTSGILLAAKNKKSAEICRENFEKGAVTKNYLALVSRKPMPPRGKWRDALFEKKAGEKIRASIAPSQKPNAFLSYVLKEYFPRQNLSLLNITLLTGKTHQIRVQTAYHGHPVAGDRIYGNFGLNKNLRQAFNLHRLFLHAWELILPHPLTKKILEIRAPLPHDLEASLGSMT